jgi:predicted phage terminase large subunit-like protein
LLQSILRAPLLSPNLSVSDLNSIVEQIEYERLRKSFEHYFLTSFGILNPGLVLKYNWHIGCISEYLEAAFRREVTKLIINIPFRMLKSSLCSIAFPSWVLGNLPITKFMCVSYSDQLATDLSVKCRQLVESDWFAKVFPEFQLAKDSNQKTRFDTTKNGYRYATSAGGSATGMGADFLLADDYMSPRMAKSDQERETALGNWAPMFQTRKNDPQKSVEIIIEQRTHDKDLTGMLLKEGGYEHLCLQGKFESKKTFSFGKFHKDVEQGELLQENRLSQEVLDRYKIALGSQDYAAQIQQSPMAEGGNIVKLQWFKRYSPALLESMQFETIVVSCDTAYQPDQLADPSCFGAWGIKDNKIYLLDLLNENLAYPDLERKLNSFLEKHKPHWTLIENRASGQSLIQKLQAEGRFAVKKIEITKEKGNKMVRLHNVSAIIEAGNVFLPERADWLFDYENQITKFPNSEKDDMVDQTSQCLAWFKDRSADLEFWAITL